MKRQKHAKKPVKKQQSGSPAAAKAPNNTMSRRNFISTLSNGALIVAASGGVGWYFIDEVCATTREIDLSRIGNGIPAVVQIHDPECPLCRALQKEAREAMSGFDENQLQYIVANVRQTKGRQLANKHGVNHVTLLLFDAKGNRKRILAGSNKSDYLKNAFANHVARYSGK